MMSKQKPSIVFHLREPTRGLNTRFPLPLKSFAEKGIASKPTQSTSGRNSLYDNQVHHDPEAIYLLYL